MTDVPPERIRTSHGTWSSGKAYSGTEYIRADLAPTDAQVMANEKVRALVEAVEAAFACGMVPKSTAKNGGASAQVRAVIVADMLRAALRDLEAGND